LVDWLSQCVVGIKVKIVLPWDTNGKTGPKNPLPDDVSIVEPKEEQLPQQPYSEQKGGKPEVAPPGVAPGMQAPGMATGPIPQ